MKYDKVKALLDRHPELDSEVLNMDEVREYLIYGNDGQKVICKPTGIDYIYNYYILEAVVGQDHIEIPIGEIRHMEMVVKFADLPHECLVINPTDAVENVFSQIDPNYKMPVAKVKLGVKGYFKTEGGVKDESELMAMNELMFDIKYKEVVDIMLDQSMFNADADHIIKHKYDAKLRLKKSEREVI